MSPKARTLKRLREEGWIAVDVEEDTKYRGKVDLLGMGDVLAMRPGKIMMVQATDGDHKANRVAKMLDSQYLSPWLAAGGLLEVWGWRKLTGRGKNKVRAHWEPDIWRAPGPETWPPPVEGIINERQT